MPSTTEPRHPIRVVSQRTGLTPATLRAWERRYGVVAPGRSEGGQRLYSDADVLRLNRLHLLTEAGRSISSVATLSDREAEALLREDRENLASTSSAEHPNGPESAAMVQESVRFILQLDGASLERELRRAAVTLGAQPFLENVLAPLLHRVGAGWSRGEMRPAHEHLCTAVVERVLTWLTEPVMATSEAPHLLITTLPGERHGLGAMLVAAATGLEGWEVTQLGTDLPLPDIVQAAAALGARAVALSVVHVADPSTTAADLAKLRAQIPGETALILGGGGVKTLSQRRIPRGALVVDGLGSLRAVLEGLA
jgi:DNA-binding transcriptional MerR regulator/methylmalonyl-CoA mutase cobalamin-binding subunit